MTRITGDWIDRPETVAVFDALERAGMPAFFVGGCVRDALSGRAVDDIDLATPALPEDVMSAAGAAGLKALPTGIAHGTVTIVSAGLAHEVTTYRRDIETDGRRAVVAFSAEMSEDAARRDFTMNALYADRAGRVLDPLGTGVADLAAGLVRFVGNPEARIAEDYLRILRYFRFLARFGAAGPDPDALAAIAAHLDGLKTLSAERVGHEMLRLLALGDPAPALATMAQTGVLMRVLPGADAVPVAVLVHLEAGAGIGPDPIRRLAALGGGDAVGRLRLSRADARMLEVLGLARTGDMGPAELGYRHGFDAARDVVLVRAALTGTALSPGDLEAARRGAEAAFPVKAADLMPELEGAALGARLKALEARWIASDFTLSRAALLGD